MNKVISSDILVAYSQCHRLAYLLLCTEEKGAPHEYVRMLRQKRKASHHQYVNTIIQNRVDIQLCPVKGLDENSDVLVNARLQAKGLEVHCDVLTRVKSNSYQEQYLYVPILFTGTYLVTKAQKLRVMYISYVLAQIQKKDPEVGEIITVDGKSHKVKLGNKNKILVPLLEPLQKWANDSSPKSPPIVLNKHCPICQFENKCKHRAMEEDNLSLLAKVTPKIIQRYEKKGIFTVKQLSYLYKPRRRKKRTCNLPQLNHKIELQALSIRTGKIYLQALPQLKRQFVELFLDIEGVPDLQFYYLFGLLVREGNTSTYHPFWADTRQDEGQMWQNFLEKVNQYNKATIYHYGSYETKAIAKLAQRYGTDCENIRKRLDNVNTHIYGKVYFPVYSNSLKEIGKFIGASWTSENASGLQSLVWRSYWDKNQHLEHKEQLLTYNEEDCQALKMLTNELSKIETSADILTEVDFADKPKQNTTEKGKLVHSQFETILKFAHANYEKRKIKFRQRNEKEGIKCTEDKATFTKKGYFGQRNVRVKATKTIQVPTRKICPRCVNGSLRPTKQGCKRLIIDLSLMKNGIKKTIVKYVGFKGYCPKCSKYFLPIEIAKYHKNQLYGAGFKAWIIYQRIALRLPYESITKLAENQFNEKMQPSYLPLCIKNTGKHYAKTEEIIIQQILKSPFIHVDETHINIKGVDEYVWVFTDRKYVFFKKTKTREASIVHEWVDGYSGILISDFYSGYDSVNCKQQKCWVHLIRDLNNDLWSAPFDKEFEIFLLEVKNMFVPIMECVQKYGLKKRNLNKFKKQVDKFYINAIIDKQYKSELTIKYQKRFIRYREKLFTFLEHDEISWHNNPAENAIRHLAIQRDISPYFSESVIYDYLRLLGIKQTCRFQGKSFFKFLFSGEIEIDKFQWTKRKGVKSLIDS